MTEAHRTSSENGRPAGMAATIGSLLGARETGLIAIIVVLCVMMSFASPYFLTWMNLRAMTLVLCSALCGVAGVIYMSRFGSAQPTFGIGMELNVIAAAVIGGASLSGGTGSIFGAILGAILLSVVSSSLTLLDVSVYWQDIIRGSILLAAVSFDHYFNKRRRSA